MEKQEERGCRVVLVPAPFQGHINPMLQLGTILHSKGFSITIAHTKFNSLNSSKHPDFNFLPIPDGLSDREMSCGDFVALVLVLNVNCLVPFQECLAKLMKQQEPHDEIACIIYDDLMYFSEAAANHLKLPSIILRTSNVATFFARLAMIQLKAEGYIPLQDPKSQEQVPKLHPLRLKDLPISHFGPLENLLKLIDYARNIRTSSAIILNTMDCLEYSSLAQLQQQGQVPIFPIGPMHKIVQSSSSSLLEEDTSCITWLDKQPHNSVIYVSLGSIASMDEKELAEMAWGLANSKQPFLWVIRPGSIHGYEWIELLPEGFKDAVGERGCIVKWAPQREVLAHSAVGGFWSHCGWNSTLESISEGVPMICRPCFGDQRVITRYLSHVWRVGLELENDLDRGEIERAIRRLMVDKEGKEMWQRAMDLKQKVASCIGEGGSSYTSLNKLVKFIKSF